MTNMRTIMSSNSIFDPKSDWELKSNKPNFNVKYWLSLTKPDFNDAIEQACNEGIKSIYKALNEGSIDKDTASEILSSFMEIYTLFKIDQSLEKLFSKSKYGELLRDYLSLSEKKEFHND